MKPFLKLDEKVLKLLREMTNKKSIQLEALLEILVQKNLSDTLVEAINQELENLNAHSEKNLLKQLKKTQAVILKRIEKDEQLVTKHHFRNTWMAYGMLTGSVLGSVLGMRANNMSLLGLWLPLGMVFGMAIGIEKDKRAKALGKQLDLDI
jgi:membrane-bound ClpP family serine protease